MKPHYLEALFSARHIAVIGASDRIGSSGQRVLSNLLCGRFTGQVTPVNLRRKMVGGLEAFAHVQDIPAPVDVAVVLTRFAVLEQVFNDCSLAHIRYVILLTPQTVSAAEQQVLAQILTKGHKKGLRLLGPSHLGVIRSPNQMNLSTHPGVLPGKMALIAQSSSVITAMLDWAQSRNIGFSTVLALGDNALDIGFGEILDYLAHDRHTDSILIQVKNAQDGRSFMSALKMVARIKPVVAIKSGKGVKDWMTEDFLAIRPSPDQVFSTALARAGVLEVQSIAQMLMAARILASAHHTQGDRLAIVCNGLGLGELAQDAIRSHPIQLATLSDATLDALNAILPADWSHTNPVDVLAEASPLRFKSAVRACLNDSNVDAVVVIFSPQWRTDHLATAQLLVQEQAQTNKPILACWLGGDKVKASRDYFSHHRQLHFGAPEYAIEAFAHLAQFRRNQALLWQTASPLNQVWQSSPFQAAHALLSQAQMSNQSVLPTQKTIELLNLFHILSIQTRLAASLDEAISICHSMGYPVALKVDSPDIAYKSAVGGVMVNIENEQALKAAYEQLLERIMVLRPHARIYGVSIQPMLRQKNAREAMIIVSQDNVFGPVISFGAGGVDAAIHEDFASALPPLNRVLIKHLINATRLSRTLGVYKNMPAIDQEALIEILLRISEMVCELPEIEAMEIDPLVLSAQGGIVLDARIKIRPIPAPDYRYGHMAIMPYPHHMQQYGILKNGEQVFIRPSRPEDAQLIQAFVRNLSDESRFNRFMSSLKELPHNLLVKFTQIDYAREMALHLVKQINGAETILGVARYTTDPDMRACEFALSIADAWQAQGVGSLLMTYLFAAAREQGLSIMRGEVLTQNKPMLKLTQKLGFTHHKNPDDPSLTLVEKNLLTG